MPTQAAEIYTYPPEAETEASRSARSKCLCRFRGSEEECDQSAHRGKRAFLKLDNLPLLQRQYGRPKIPLGLCTLWNMRRNAQEPWIVCPHRLFFVGAKSDSVDNAIYQAWGLVRGDRVALWKEIKIQRKRGSKVFNFTFDYVFRRVVSENPFVCEKVPYLVEVMTASTAGGQVEDAFVNGLQNTGARTRTSINYRQIIARMMSQFIAKAQAAAGWGGRAVWIVQDLLWRYVESTTGFNRDEFYDDPRGNVIVLIRKLDTSGFQPTSEQADCFLLRLEQIVRGWDRYERREGDSYEGRDFVSMLNAPFVPERRDILNATQRQPVAILTCK